MKIQDLKKASMQGKQITCTIGTGSYAVTKKVNLFLDTYYEHHLTPSGAESQGRAVLREVQGTFLGEKDLHTFDLDCSGLNIQTLTGNLSWSHIETKKHR